mmetsp:Transcript_124546/g.348822  ORF Transcript_124546/g.348822 Transcript_124546/m.348822 type:complete len:293 (+) Transcript_124546:259-1137(+)
MIVEKGRPPFESGASLAACNAPRPLCGAGIGSPGGATTDSRQLLGAAPAGTKGATTAGGGCRGEWVLQREPSKGPAANGLRRELADGAGGHWIPARSRESSAPMTLFEGCTEVVCDAVGAGFGAAGLSASSVCAAGEMGVGGGMLSTTSLGWSGTTSFSRATSTFGSGNVGFGVARLSTSSSSDMSIGPSDTPCRNLAATWAPGVFGRFMPLNALEKDLRALVVGSMTLGEPTETTLGRRRSGELASLMRHGVFCALGSSNFTSTLLNRAFNNSKGRSFGSSPNGCSISTAM